MGLRSRLKSTVKSILGVEPAAPPVAAARPAPVAQAPPPPPVTRAAPAPAPVAQAPEPVAPAPEPVAPAPEPVAPEPEPVAPEPVAPEPVAQAREPEPAPSAPTAEPVAQPPEPAPVGPAPTPAPRPTGVTFESDYETSDAPVRNAHYRKRAAESGTSFNVRVYNEAEDLDITFACEPGEYVLEAAERAGYELPYSCRSGGCLTCSGKVHEGQVEMGEQYVLDDDHQARGFILLCLTAVKSDAVFESHQQDNIE